MSDQMEFTGERFVPQVHGNIELEHMHRYLMACELAPGKDVLDIASGEGYGSARMAQSAKHVYGVDISVESIEHAKSCYPLDNVSFLVGSCDCIPLPDKSVDLIVSFETIEHHDKHEEMMIEFKRVLRPGGAMLISSPDKQIYSIEANYSNPFHVKELFVDEFKELISKHFSNSSYYGQKIAYGSTIFEEAGSCSQKTYWDHESQILSKSGIRKPVYLLALASDGELPALSSGIYERPESESSFAAYLYSVVAERDAKIEGLNQLVKQRDALHDILRERDIEIAATREMVREREDQIAATHEMVREREDQIARVNLIARNLKAETVKHKREIEALSGLIESAKKWQKRSWFKRAFHRWRVPGSSVSKKNRLKQWEKSLRKRRDKLLGKKKTVPRQDLVAAVTVAPPAKKKVAIYKDDKSSNLYVPKCRLANPTDLPVKAICFYLPQFHEIPENNRWWGEGFTEWTNVKPAKPQYDGHYQPRVPGELGYYNLLESQTQQKQIDLAKLYGIGGFCFYFYWFKGTRLLEAPILNYLADTSLDLPFCLCWANENWSRRWDGSDADILIAQEHSPEDDLEFIKYVSAYLRDSRYIRVGGKPLLLVYRPSLLPEINATVILWRKWCRENGVGEIYLAYTQSFEKNDPCEFGFDAAVEFPPNSLSPDEVAAEEMNCDSAFTGKIYDLKSLCDRSKNYKKQEYKLFRGVCPSWDNTARKKNRSTIFVNDRPEFYQSWLENAVTETVETFTNPDERLVFINAWNEWAEGAHLEPDQKYGYAWLDATRRALVGGKTAISRTKPRVLVIGHDAHMAGAQIVLLSLLREWKKTGVVDFELILGAGGVFREQFEALADTLVISDLKKDEELDKQLRRVVSRDYDIVLSSTVTNGMLLERLWGCGLRIPIITYSHELQKSIERWAAGGIMERTIAYSGRFIAGGVEVGRNLVEAHKIPEKRLDVVNGFIDVWDDDRVPDLEARKKLADELDIRDDEIVVFGCGTTDWRKGPDLFLSIAQHCCAKSDRIRFFWIGGDGDEYNVLAANSGLLKQIRFLPNTYESRRYYYNGHIFLLSSREDPFPLVALEAADAGLPIVCFENAGGMPRFVKDDAGVVVPFEDVTAASDAILTLSSNQHLRRRLGGMGRGRVRDNYSTPIAATRIADILAKTSGFSTCAEQIVATPVNGPLVSVIVPNYNHEKYLPQRLASISNQSIGDIEIILMDDASTDGSMHVLQDFAAFEPRARLIPNQHNSGSTFKQWKKGIMEARGKYIWIAESDDSAEPQLLEKLVSLLESDPEISLACCQLRMMDPQGKLGGTPDDWLCELDSERWKSSYTNRGMNEIRCFLSKKNTILNASGVVFRRFEGIESLVDVSMRLCADWLFWARLSSLGKIAFHAEPLNHWRLQTSNARTRPTGELEWKEGRRVIEQIAEILNSSDVETDEMVSNHRRKCDEWIAKFHSEENLKTESKSKSENSPESIVVKNSGFCPVCDKEVEFTSRSSWLRDHYFCDHCKSIPRERAVMHVIEKHYPNWRCLAIHESSPGSSEVSAKLRRECDRYTGTQYDLDVPFGSKSAVTGYQSEDLEKQTFEDAVFDIVVTQDVMEHIFDPELAFKEIHRTLKPGGAHIFTTPLVNKDKVTEQWARRNEEGEIEYLHPAEYHGNPMSDKGSLVTWHWGFDIVDIIHNATGSDVELVDCHSVEFGIEGEYIEVVVQKKPR